MPFTIHPQTGDITRMQVDAIVNSANTSLMGGGGVDGAIHEAAGPDLERECYYLGGCEVGEARLTGGFRLAARFIIHAVGPMWRGGSQGESELLAAAYRNAMDVAIEHDVTSLAFPCISTGVYGFPYEMAASIAVSVVRSYQDRASSLKEVIFCCFSPEDNALYERLLSTEHPV